MKLFFWEKRSQNMCIHCKCDFVLHDFFIKLTMPKVSEAGGSSIYFQDQEVYDF